MVTRCFIHSSTDPYFNLAAEEYFLKNFTADFFILWRSQPTVVVGKHQNALSEIDHDYTRNHQIPVARRLSGGGTVFHDLGNVNFSFIRNVEKIQDVNFKIFTLPIVEALKKLGVEAYSTGRNDILIDQKKISGNAEHVHRNRVLHHGTLLFNSKLDTLKGALKVDLSKFDDKAVQSKRSEVVNIAAFLKKPLSVEDFTEYIFNEIMEKTTETIRYELSVIDQEKILKLSNEKYRTWEWIFGYSPRYRYTNMFQTGTGAIQISFFVEHGLISNAMISGIIPDELSRSIAQKVEGCRHEYFRIFSELEYLKSLFSVQQINFDDFVKAWF